MKTIVVGYDGTEQAQRALERAADIGEAFGAKVVVTSVTAARVGGFGVGAIDPTDTPEEHHVDLVQAREYLSSRKVSAEYQPAVGDPADTIIEVAKTVGADLIVVGTREPNLVQRLLGQSVSESVQRQAHCDVLIVHSH